MPSPQQPIGSGFGFSSTAEEVASGVDLSGKLAVVTGGYSGIGLETSRVLADAGATVVVPARTPDKAREALASEVPSAELESLDLADPASIDSFAERFLASGRTIDLLINSAGVMAMPLTRDARGYEMQFATNHLGHFQLTARLWPALTDGGARVVALSSLGHRRGAVDFEDPNFERREYEKWQAYGQSKTADALFALELDTRGTEHGVRAFSVHPGGILTDLIRHLPVEEQKRMGALDEQGNRVQYGSIAQVPEGLKSVHEGAATSVWCATSPQLDGYGGVYCENCDIAEPVPADAGEDTRYGVRPWACDPEQAARLWPLSERLTGVEFAI